MAYFIRVMKLFWHIIKFTFNAENAVYLVCSDFYRLLSSEFYKTHTRLKIVPTDNRHYAGARRKGEMALTCKLSII